MDRPRTPEFSDIPLRYLYVKVERLREVREEIEMEGMKWRVVEVNYGDNNEFYNANGTMARLTVIPVEQFDQNGELIQFGHHHDLSEFEAAVRERAPEMVENYNRLVQDSIRAEVEAMDWPDIIDG